MLDDLYEELAYYDDLLEHTHDEESLQRVKATISKLLREIKHAESLGSRWG